MIPYLPGVVTAVWALSWAFGLRGHAAVTAWLTALAVALLINAQITRSWRRGR